MEELHRVVGLRDVAEGRAVVVQCPDCGQMEMWTVEEVERHGTCRCAAAPCWCEGDGVAQ